MPVAYNSPDYDNRPYRAYVFTIYQGNTPGIPDPYSQFGSCAVLLSDPPTIGLDEGIKWILYQLERCPTTARLHLQGVVVFTSPVRRGGAQARLRRPTAHVQRMRGSIDENIVYCSKLDTRVQPPVEYGDRPIGAGSRTDMVDFVDLVRESDTLHDLAVASPVQYLRHWRGAAALRAALFPPTERPTVSVYVLYGSTGTGKSRAVYRCFPDAYWWTEPTNGSAYAFRYDAQRVVCLDEFDGWLSFSFLLRLLDRYPLWVNTQGDSAPWCATTIIITFMYPVEHWYDRTKYNLAALRRRITCVYNFNEMVGNELFTIPGAVAPSPEMLRTDSDSNPSASSYLSFFPFAQ